MKYKALICDVDGTLILNVKGSKPTQKVVDAVGKASQQIHVGIASLRPLIFAKPIIRYFNLSGPSIINGGAQIIDSKAKKILWEQPLLLEDAQKVCKILSKENLNFIVQDNGKDVVYDISYTLKKPLTIFSFGNNPETAKRLIETISKIPTVAVHTVPDWEKGKTGISVSHAAATKQHGILEVAQLLNIETHEIIGVGDGGIDFPLLMACGLKVAMGNADESLKAIADYIAPSVEEDGVADVIEKFVLQNRQKK